MTALNKLTKVTILVLILAVPGFLYYLLTAEGKNRYKPLPIFGPKYLAKTSHTVKGKLIPDTIFHQAADFDLKDQDGNAVSFKTLGKKILVINFFYTHCPSVCTELIGNMDSLATYYSKNKLVAFLSITVDPQRDNAAVLKSYSARFKLPAAKWLFLSGDTTAIYSFANKGLLVDALQNGKDDFIYSDKIILLDTEHRIRGYYAGTSVAEVNRLNDELKVQIAEELRKNDKPLY